MWIDRDPPGGPRERAFRLLEERGYCVIDGFFSADEAQACVFELERLRERGDLRAARIGTGRARTLRTDVRGAFLHWFEERDLSPVQRRLWNRIDGLRDELKNRFRLPLAADATEAHYALYPPGSFYARHRDNFQPAPGEAPKNNRIFSFVLYLNPNWRPEHAGELRLYLEDDRAEIVDVQPAAGTLALFDSLAIEHEILPTLAERRSVCGWLCSPKGPLRI